MSDLPANNPALSSQAGWPAPAPPSEGWSRRKFVIIFVILLALHIAFIFVLGTKKQIVPRAIGDIPHLQLVDGQNEFIALNDPTLFARPNPHDIVSAFWRHMEPPSKPNFNWSADPRYLAPPTNNFGRAYSEYVRTNPLVQFAMNLMPAPQTAAPALLLDEAMPQASDLQLSDELSRRGLLNTVNPPSPAYKDVVPPTQVQVLVDTAGNVASVTLLESSTSPEIDQKALQLATQLRFTPATRLTLGEITFTWHITPTNPPASNTVPATVP